MIIDIVDLIKKDGFSSRIDIFRLSRKLGIEFIYRSKDKKQDSITLDKILTIIKKNGFGKNDINYISKKIVSVWDFLSD